MSGDTLVELGQCFDQISEGDCVDDAVDRIDEILNPLSEEDEEDEEDEIYDDDDDCEDEDSEEDEDENEEEVTIEEEVTLGPKEPAPLKVKPVEQPDIPACVVCEDDEEEDLGCELCEDEGPEPEPLTYKHEIINRPKVTANGWVWTGWNNNK